MNQRIHTQDLTKMALLTALLCASAYIIIPIPFSPVSVTAQTLVVNLIAFLLTPVQAAITILAYLLIGLVGLPVFSGAGAGPGVLLGPTGGYLISWAPAAALISFLKGREYNLPRFCGAAIFAGMPVIYLFGSIYMKLMTGMTWSATLAAAVLPFIPLDVFKCIAAGLIAKPIRYALRQTC